MIAIKPDSGEVKVRPVTAKSSKQVKDDKSAVQPTKLGCDKPPLSRAMIEARQ